MTYPEYLNSKAWQSKRKKVLKRAEYKCQVCNSADRLDVHYRTYERIFKEKLSDLIALCGRCHNLFHHVLPKRQQPILVDIEIKIPTVNKKIQYNDKLLETCTDDNTIKQLLRENMELLKHGTKEFL